MALPRSAVPKLLAILTLCIAASVSTAQMSGLDMLKEGLQKQNDKDRIAAIAKYKGTDAEAAKAAELIAAVLGDKTVGVQQAAAAALVRIGDKAALPVAQILKNQDAAARKNAFAVLAKLGPKAKEAAPVVAKLLVNQPDETRQEAVRLLKLMGPGAVQPVLEVLKDNEKTVQDTLRQMGPAALKEALPLAVKMTRDKDVAVRRAATSLLGTIPDGKSAVATLAELMCDADEQVRSRAAKSLAAFPKDAMAPLIDQLKNADNHKHFKAITELVVKLGPQHPQPLPAGLVPALAKHLDNKDQQVRSAVLKVVLPFANRAKEMAEAVVPLLAEKNVELRNQAVAVLDPMHVNALPGIVKNFKSANDEVRFAALSYFVRYNYKTKEVLAELLPLLTDKDARIRQKTADLLRNAQSADALWPLAATLADNNAEVRRTAGQVLEALMYLKLPEKSAWRDKGLAAAAQAAKFEDPQDKQVRSIAKDVLSKANPEKLPPALANLRSDNPTARFIAFNNLSKAKQVPKEAIPLVVEGMRTGNVQIRQLGVRILTRALPDSEAALIELAGDKDINLRRMTIESLDQPGNEGKNILNVLFVTLTDADPNVRDVTGRILARFAALGPRPGWTGPEPEKILPLLKSDKAQTQIMAAHFIAASGKAAREAIPVLAAGVRGDKIELRQPSLTALTSILPESRDVVKSLLADKDAAVRLATAQALQRGTPDGDAVMEMLTKALNKDADLPVREAAAVSLARFGAPAVAVLVKPAATGDMAPFKGLSKLKENAVPQLIELANHKNLPVRLAAMKVLGEFRFLPPDKVAEIRKLREDPQREVRDAAILVILRLQNLGVDDLEVLIDTLHDPSGDNRRAASRQLVNLRGVAVPRLLELIDKGQSPVARAEAVFTLGQMGPIAVNAVKPLISLVRSDKAENVALRTFALAALERMGPSVDAGLLGILVDADPAAQVAVLEMLAAPTVTPAEVARLERAKLARDLMIEMLRARQPEVRTAAARALARLGPDIAKELEPVLAEKDGDVRAAALLAVEKFTPIEVLAKYLRDDKQAVRDVAGRALARHGAAAYGVLRQALRDKDYRVQVAAADAIRPVTDRADDLLPPLVDILLNKEARDLEMQAAARAIGRISSIAAVRLIAEKASVAEMLELLRKQPAEVRELACLALAEKGPAAADALPLLGELLKQPRTDVSLLAAAARAVDAISSKDRGQIDPTAAQRIVPDLAARLVKNTQDRSTQLRDEIMTGLQQQFSTQGPNSAEVLLAALQMGQNADDASNYLAFRLSNLPALSDAECPGYIRMLALFHAGNKNFAVKLSPAAEQAIREHLWRYLMDERGERGSRIKPLAIAQVNSVLPIDQMVALSSAYLALDLLRDDPLYKDRSLQGRTLQDLHQEWTLWWREWARERARKGLWSEMGAPEYQLPIWACLLNLIDCASDPVLKQRFKMLLDLTAIEEEQVSIEGTRSGRRTRMAAAGCGLDQWKDVLQGQRPRRLGEPSSGFSGIVWSSNYQLPPAAILLRKLDRPEQYYSVKNRHFFGGCVFGYVAPHYVLGCQMTKDEGTMVGSHELYGVWHRLIFDDMRGIFFPLASGERWHVQHQSVYIGAWNDNVTARQEIRFSADLKTVEQGEWLFVSNGPAFAAIFVEEGYTLNKPGIDPVKTQERLSEVIFKNPRALVILQAGDVGKFGSFEKFQEAILKAPLVLSKGSLRYTGPQSAEIEFFRDRTRAPIITGVQPAKVKMTYDSPYLQGESGQTQFTVRVGSYAAVYDFDNNVVREEKK